MIKKQVLLLVTFLFILLKLSSQTIEISVKDQNGTPLDEKTSIEVFFYSKEKSINTKLESDGSKIITNPYSSSAPYINIKVEREGYDVFEYAASWSKDIILPITLESNETTAQAENKINDLGRRIDKKIQSATFARDAAMKSSSKDRSKVDTAAFNKIITQLQEERKKVKALKRKVNDKDRELVDIEGDLIDIETEYKTLSSQLSRLKIIEADFKELEQNISMELYECRCLNWNNDYIDIWFSIKDGRNGSTIINEPTIVLELKEKNNPRLPARVILIDGEVSKEIKILNNGTGRVTLKLEEDELRRIENFQRQNYYIYFYNKRLYEYRNQHKISMGVVEIIDLKESCGEKTPLEIIRS